VLVTWTANVRVQCLHLLRVTPLSVPHADCNGPIKPEYYVIILTCVLLVVKM